MDLHPSGSYSRSEVRFGDWKCEFSTFFLPLHPNGAVGQASGVDWAGKEQNGEGRHPSIHFHKFILEQNLHFSSYQTVRQKSKVTGGIWIYDH